MHYLTGALDAHGGPGVSMPIFPLSPPYSYTTGRGPIRAGVCQIWERQHGFTVRVLKGNPPALTSPLQVNVPADC